MFCDFFFFQAEDGIRYKLVTGVQTCALPISSGRQVDRAQFGTAALSVALSPDEAVLYVGLLFAGRVVQLDRPTLRVLARLETGGKPRRIAFDATGRSALIANEAGWVDLVHLAYT